MNDRKVIYLDDAIDAVISLCDDCDSDYCGSCRVNYPGEKDARKVLESLPSAQPEIIRCKDCKWCRGWIDTNIDFCDLAEGPVFCDDFCSRAERREE